MATFFVSVAVLVATAMPAERRLRRLVWVRRGCVAAAGLLVAAGVLGIVSHFALAVACVAGLLCLHAIRIAMRRPAPLQSYLDRLVSGGDAAWKTEFEQPFAEYARRQHHAPH